MKKRILCAILTLIMLVSLVPAGAISASAATATVSEAGITVLKKLIRYYSTCQELAEGKYYIGYGLVCDEDHDDGERHTTTQTKADTALRAALKSTEEAVANFASRNGLSLSQGKFDALVSYSYEKGTAWMNGTGTFKNAVVEGYTGNDFLNAIADTVIDTRRMSEANMYLNGSYSANTPSKYTELTFDANASDAKVGNSKTYMMIIDTTLGETIDVTPTRSGYTFLGWYTKSTGGSLVTTLGKDYGTLYAMWQKTGSGQEIDVTDYTTTVSSFTTGKPLESPNSTKEIGVEWKSSDKVTVSAEYVDADGYKWCKVTKDSKTGWLKVGKYSGTASGEDFDMDITVTVTNSYVNIRSSSTVFSSTVRKANQGEQLRIVATKQGGDGYFWGKVVDDDGEKIGWVALMYTNYDAIIEGTESSDDGEANSEIVATAVVSCANYVNVRSGAGTNNKIIGSLANGTKVNLFEITTVNGVKWGRTTQGWFSLTYANVTMKSATTTSSSTSTSFAATVNTASVLRESAGSTAAVAQKDKKDVTVAANASVTISALKSVNGTDWAKISGGWIELSKLDITPVVYNVTASKVSVMSEAGSGSVVETLPQNYEVTIYEIDLVDGTIWGKTNGIYDYGWIALNTGNVKTQSGSTSAGGYANATVVGAQNVNVRKSASLYAAKLRTVAYGTTLIVDEDSVKTGSGYQWIMILDENGNENGWICMDYVQIYEDTGVVGGTTTGSADGAIVGTGIVTSAIGLNIRQGAGLGYASVGRLEQGANVTVYEQTMEGGMIWGRIDQGWICLSYVQMLTSGTNGSGVMGTVANTYGGLNVRSAAGSSYALVGKLLPGARVEIYQQKKVGNSYWGQTSQGWVCMDYIVLDSEMGGIDGSTGSTGSNDSTASTGNNVNTISVAYEGTIKNDVDVKKTVGEDAVTDRLAEGETVTIHELASIVEEVEGDPVTNADGSISTTTTKTTTYWARVNEGWIESPEDYIDLESLDGDTYTVTGSETLNVRTAPGTENSSIEYKLQKGTQVSVTSLQIVKNTVWGYIKTDAVENVTTDEEGNETVTTWDGNGWVSLVYMTKGAVDVSTSTDSSNTTNNTTSNTTGTTTGTTGTTTTTTTTTNVGYSYGNTGSGSYTGKIIRDNPKVRASASTNADVVKTLSIGDSVYIRETVVSEGRAWGRCDAGWVYLYYVDLTPYGSSAIDARVIYNEGTSIYSGAGTGDVIGSYSKMAVIDIYEQVGKWVRTDLGWVNTDNLL